MRFCPYYIGTWSRLSKTRRGARVVDSPSERVNKPLTTKPLPTACSHSDHSPHDCTRAKRLTSLHLVGQNLATGVEPYVTASRQEQGAGAGRSVILLTPQQSHAPWNGSYIAFLGTNIAMSSDVHVPIMSGFKSTVCNCGPYPTTDNFSAQSSQSGKRCRACPGDGSYWCSSAWASSGRWRRIHP